MNEPPFRSMLFGGPVFQYGLFILSLLALGVGVAALRTVVVGGLILLALGACLFYAGTISRTKFGVVIADDAGITIQQGGREFEIPWSEVIGLTSIPFISPPLYRLRYRQTPGVTYFTPGRGGTIHIGVWSWGFSAMARYIRLKMKAHTK
jgi:hypothetical protein